MEKTKQTADEWRHYMTWEMEMIAERDIAYEEGVEKGMKQGKFETARENAKKLLSKNVSLEIISECTGLPFKTVLSLKNE